MTDLIPGVAQARTAGRVALWLVVALVGGVIYDLACCSILAHVVCVGFTTEVAPTSSMRVHA
jgi:hypothetical protein